MVKARSALVNDVTVTGAVSVMVRIRLLSDVAETVFEKTPLLALAVTWKVTVSDAAGAIDHAPQLGTTAPLLGSRVAVRVTWPLTSGLIMVTPA